jgi:outer membrane protein OmpA-like peptidoglycan-associated protein
LSSIILHAVKSIVFEWRRSYLGHVKFLLAMDSAVFGVRLHFDGVVYASICCCETIFAIRKYCWGESRMSSIVKVLIGGIVTALLTWLFWGPLGFGAKCMGTGVPEVEAAAPVAAVTPPVEAPATAAAVANCQGDVDAAIKGKTINFGSGNAEITSYSMPVVEALAKAAKDCAGTAIEVAGHTDQQGDDASNMKLSEARANAVVAALSERGVPKERMTAKGYGETKLLDQGSSSDALAKNRRIEFTVATAAAAAAAPATAPQ